jgi:hypothetical protein
MASDRLVRCFASLRFSGALDFTEIERVTGLTPTETIRKGDPAPVPSFPRADEDFWIYTPKVDEGRPPSEHVKAVLVALRGRDDEVKRLAKTCKAHVWLSYRTELAQGQVSLASELVERCARLGLGVEVSIFSWGGVEREKKGERRKARTRGRKGGRAAR